MRLRVPQLLLQLCNVMAAMSSPMQGGQSYPNHQRLFAVIYRVFANRSLDDAVFEMAQIYATREYGWSVPSRHTLSAFYRDASLIALLRDCLKHTARQVRKIETMGIIDSSGFASTPTQVYLDTDRGRQIIREANHWKKAHIVCGGITGLIASVIMTHHEGKIDENEEKARTADVNFFKPLFTTAHEVWDHLEKALGDKAYLSSANIQVCEELGLKPFIPVKKDWKKKSALTGLESWMYFIYCDSYESFQEIYRYRTKIEGVFSALKRTCEAYFRGRGKRTKRGELTSPQELKNIDIAAEVELLCKCISYNLRRLVVLERLHDHEVVFGGTRAFESLDPSWIIKPNGFDYDEEAAKDEADEASDLGLDDGESGVA
jgi:hypothetical protein